MNKNLITTALILIALTGTATSLSIAISPSITRTSIARGQEIVQNIRVTTQDEGTFITVVSVTGSAKGWTTILNPSVNVTKNQPGNIKVNIQIPPEATNGDYESKIYITLQPYVEATSQDMGMSAEMTGVALIEITVTGTGLLEQKILHIDIESAKENDPIRLNTIIANSGNILLRTALNVNILDQDKNTLNKEFNEYITLPEGTQQPFNFNITSGLPAGRYWANVTFLFNNIKKQNIMLPFTVQKNQIKRPETTTTTTQTPTTTTTPTQETPQNTTKTPQPETEQPTTIPWSTITLIILVAAIAYVLYWSKKRETARRFI
ncbi:Uncharacterised protein [uncultured archaeon]|nr:Uncharacterised protein [uncultured archaeon]